MAADEPQQSSSPIPAQPVGPSPVLSYADPHEEESHANRIMMEQLPGGGVSFLLRAPGVLREMATIVALSVTLSLSIVLLMYLGIVPCAVVAVMAVIMIFAVVRSATQPGLIEVRDGTLTQISPAAIFRPQRQWSVDEVKQLRVSWRGVSLRGRSVADLEMTLKSGGGVVQLFAGRDKRELEWMARHLRIAMHLESAVGASELSVRPN